MITKKYLKKDLGFTLVEMIVAVGLFAIVMTVAAGAIFSIVGANRNAQSLNSVISNLNFTVESMLRDIRTGYNYSCLDSVIGGVSGGLGDAPSDCSVNGGSTLSFITSDGNQSQYAFDADNHQIVKTQKDHVTTQVITGAITAPEVYIESMTFYVGGAAAPSSGNPTVQPHVLVRLRGHAGVGSHQSNFDIQTFVSQRVLNVQ